MSGESEIHACLCKTDPTKRERVSWFSFPSFPLKWSCPEPSPYSSDRGGTGSHVAMLSPGMVFVLDFLLLGGKGVVLVMVCSSKPKIASTQPMPTQHAGGDARRLSWASALGLAARPLWPECQRRRCRNERRSAPPTRQLAPTDLDFHGAGRVRSRQPLQTAVESIWSPRAVCSDSRTHGTAALPGGVRSMLCE